MAKRHRSRDQPKQGANKERWQRVVKDRALAPLLPRVIIETKGESLLKVLQSGTVSTNVYLRLMVPAQFQPSLSGL